MLQRREAAFVLAYAAVYGAYLWVHPESELLHWIGLVLLPLAGIAAIGRYPSARGLLRSIGLDAAGVRRGWWLALCLAALFQGLQLANATQRAALATALGEPRALLVVPLTFVLLVGTAATTEEVFFRGIVQSRLADALGSESAALLIATGLFALYHLPYTYSNPGWASAGDSGAAVRAAALNGLLGGVPLGLVFWRSRRNLAAVIVLHACIDLIPAIRLVDRLVR